MEKNVLLKIEYDGSNFKGWQRQPEVRTVQGVLEEALSKFCACDIQLNGTSRTDAGVHALGQCASFKADFGIPVEKLKFAVNNYLQGGMSAMNPVGDVRIISAVEVDSDFHARFDCKGKTYRYLISNGKDVDIFRRNYCYQVLDELDIERMRAAAHYIIGTHDFRCFQAAGGNERETTVRTVSDLVIKEKDVKHKGDGLEFDSRSIELNNTESTNKEITIEITGDGFLYNMVRIIVGTLVEVGLGKRNPESVKEIIDSCDRTNAGHTAPPGGLYLLEIYY